MTTALASVDVDRLGKLLRLALIADQDGEAIGAIRALRRALTACGLGPHDLVDAFERGTKSIAVPLAAEHDESDVSLVWWAWHRRDRLTPKEASFIEALTRWRGPISERQAQWLHDIADRLEREAAA
jgi:DNA-binding transcriptional LysR family regulator